MIAFIALSAIIDNIQWEALRWQICWFVE
jgi:predicted nucleic acid-binding protein